GKKFEPRFLSGRFRMPVESEGRVVLFRFSPAIRRREAGIGRDTDFIFGRDSGRPGGFERLDLRAPFRKRRKFVARKSQALTRPALLCRKRLHRAWRDDRTDRLKQKRLDDPRKSHTERGAANRARQPGLGPPASEPKGERE